METQEPNQESPASKASEDSRLIFSQRTRSSTGTPVVQPAARRKASLPLTPASTPLPNLKRKQPPASSPSSDPEETSVPSKKKKKMKGKKSLAKNVSQKEKVAKEEEKYREDTKALVEEATSTVSGLTYSRVEVLPAIIAEATHKGERQRAGQRACPAAHEKFLHQPTSERQDRMGRLDVRQEDDELLVPPPFCKKEVVQEFVDKWKAAGLINPEGDDWNNIPLAVRNGLQLFLKKNMLDGSLPMQAFVGLHTSSAIQRLHEGDPKNPLWQTIKMSKL
eukprot:g55906.t1